MLTILNPYAVVDSLMYAYAKYEGTNACKTILSVADTPLSLAVITPFAFVVAVKEPSLINDPNLPFTKVKLLKIKGEKI